MRRWLDAWHFMQGLTPLRVWNATQVIVSYYLSRLFGKPIHWGMPIAISIEPITSCNLRCPQCPSGLRSFSRPTGMLDSKWYEQVMDEIGPRLTYLTLYFQGEPLLHPDFGKLVKKASDMGIYTATSSNAHHITPAKASEIIASGISRFIISIDGIDQESYSHYRIGGNLDKVLNGTKELVAAKRSMGGKTHIIWQFIVFKHNEHQIKAIRQLAKAYGVGELKIKTAQVYDLMQGDDWIPQNEAYRRYEYTQAAGFSIKNKLLNHCWRLWHACVLTWDGKLVPCCFDKDASHTLGEVSEKGLRTVWKGEKMQQFRASVNRSRREIDICKNCTEGTRVWG